MPGERPWHVPTSRDVMDTPPTHQPAAGWYPDPDNERRAESGDRFWDDTRWTGHRVEPDETGPPRTPPAIHGEPSHSCGAQVRYQRNRAAFHVCIWVGFLCLWLSWIALPYLPKQIYGQRCRRAYSSQKRSVN